MMDSISPHKCNCGFRKSGLSFIKMKDMEEKKTFTDATPDYYNDGDISCIEAMVAAKGLEKTIAFCECCAFKYEWRLGKKDSIGKEVSKIKKYLDLYLELTERLECNRLGKENIIGVFTARKGFSILDNNENLLSIDKGKMIVVEEFCGLVNGGSFRCRNSQYDFFFLSEEELIEYCIGWATAREEILKKKGLSARQIKDILNKE